MVPKWVCVLVFALTILAVDHANCGSHQHGHVPAPAPAPAPAVDCSTLILDMTDCLSFVSNGSSTPKPEGNCCTGFANVLNNGPSCICEAFKSSAQLGVVLNLTKASTLPAACKLPASEATNCGLPEPPTAAPGSSSSPSAGGSVAAPSPASSSSKSSGSSAPSVSAGIFVAFGVAVMIVSLFSF